MKTRIYIDCTELLRAESNTGIQRVERNIISGLRSLKSNTEIDFKLTFYDSEFGFIEINNLNDGINSAGYLPSIKIATREPWRVKKLYITIFHYKHIRKIIKKHWNQSRFLITISLLPLAIAFSTYAYFFSKKPKNIWTPSKSDIFVILGSFWWSAGNINALSKIKASETKIVTLIHDLIPITHSQLCDDNYAKSFISNISRIIESSDLIIGNSLYTSSSIQNYISNSKSITHKKIEHFKLGHNLDLIDFSENIRNPLISALKHDKAFISVGTIEPRKNHLFLLDAFELIWKKHPKTTLCIIGKQGWKSDNTIERIKSHKMYGSSLFWFSDLSDSELTYCYKYAKALIFPSICEGFGLPLVEALMNNCPVLASDIPVFREIGGDNCIYFSLEQPSYLSKLIQEVNLDQTLNLKRLANYTWPTWKESAEEFYKIIENNLILRSR